LITVALHQPIVLGLGFMKKRLQVWKPSEICLRLNIAYGDVTVNVTIILDIIHCLSSSKTTFHKLHLFLSLSINKENFCCKEFELVDSAIRTNSFQWIQLFFHISNDRKIISRMFCSKKFGDN
jgi:hypothetical protein